MVNYLSVLPQGEHEFTWVPLVALRNRGLFEARLTRVRELLPRKMRIYPIFLESPNSALRNLLNPRILLTDFCRIARTVSELAPDAVVVFYLLDSYPALVLRPVFGYLLCVVATGGDVNLRQGWGHRLLRRLICWRADVVLAVSDDLRVKISRETGREPILMPTGIDTSFFRKLQSRDGLRRKWCLNDKDLIILTVANLEKHKGVDLAIQSIRILKNWGIQNAKLMVVGLGSESTRLRDLATELDVEKSVHFLGEVGRGDLLELYNLADLFVLSSYSEGLPFSLLEAMGCGTVCVASAVGDIPTVVQEGHNGFIVKPVSPLNFAVKLRRAFTMDQSDLASIGRNARQTVVEKFDLARIVESLLDTVFISAIRKREHGPRSI